MDEGGKWGREGGGRRGDWLNEWEEQELKEGERGRRMRVVWGRERRTGRVRRREEGRGIEREAERE